ncbi:MAG: hypothetical protein P4L92_19230 [Rudaea sp.]|nr:hypothetical protein [Rudaea sp.]
MRIHHFALLALSTSMLVACGKSQNSADAPLAFVPADTPYVYANLEPMPAAVTEQWSRRMQDYWPAVFGMYDRMLQQLGDGGDAQNQRIVKIARALIDEIKQHDSWDKLRQIGLKPDARVAFYGVGIVPVLRLELGDATAFKAEIASIEAKVGEKIPVARTGDQEYWQLGNAKIAAVIAIEGTHLVVTAVPPGAGDTLKQTLLGITRPAQTLAAAGTLQALAKQYGYSPYGEGYVDFVHLTERLGNGPTGSDAEFAKALDLPVTPVEANCRAEFLDIAHRFPRFVAGAEEITPQRLRVGAQLEIETGLAQQIATALGAAPGTGQPGDGVVDISIALPVLRLKDFWIRQADAVAAKPFACAGLAKLNDSYRDSRQKIDVTVPPPFSDLTGMRFTLDKLEFDGSLGTPPNFAGKFLMATTNPMAALAMAQLTVPGLANLKIAADGKPVPLPAGLAPAGTPPLFAAMSDKALAIAAGAGEDAGLGAYLSAPPASEPVFMRMYFSGKIYALMAQSFEKIKAAMPADKQAQLDEQAKLLAMYEKWLRSGEITFIATKTGIAMHETVEQN